ncbi:Sds3-like-domain-containing protein [Aspergillus pseudoustus]|uniref:Sds3-like-domain-containing protein n=1 Tax=Aspergillus pseudoustus TaxID=1810923 RepID=A0ABR4KPU1_9EURO
MEVAESTEPATVGAPTSASESVFNGDQNLLLHDSLLDDGRSSSLSEIDDVSEHMPSDYESPKPEKIAPENDSEAETERIDDSPNNYRLRTNIVVSASGYGPSPSKLVHSTTYDEAEEDDDDEEEEEHPADESPSKSRSKNGRAVESIEEIPELEDSTLSSSSAGKKRKRRESGDDLISELDDDDLPPHKRRGSVKSLKSDLSDPPPDLVLTPEPMEEPIEQPPMEEKPMEEPVDDVLETDLPSAPTRAKRAKKGKRKGRKTRDAEEDPDSGAVETGADIDDTPAGDDAAVRPEDADDGEAAAKLEEESKRTSAMDSLAVLEREFATLRDKIYDERISKLNRELDMLNGPNPTHPELLRQLECVKQYRDTKIHYEHTLFQYRLKSLLNKSQAERSQAHSTYFQRARDIREKHSSVISKQFYSIQHDRFKTDDVSSQHYISFPTRRSQQISHQTAYNQEVSVLAGVSKYVGFPAAPTLSSARPSELEDDLEKMGISIEPKVVAASHHHSTIQRAPVSNYQPSAEEAFLEQTPWANPQHPIHQHQHLSHPSRQVHSRATFATPAGQMRMVDVNVPNGSASTIAENSSANNTPYGAEQEMAPSAGAYPDYDADRRSGFRSLSSSPLDVRKPHPASYTSLDHRPSQSASRNLGYSPPSSRLGLFGPTAPKRDTSPTLPSKPVSSLHQSAAVLSSAGQNSMVAR